MFRIIPIPVRLNHSKQPATVYVYGIEVKTHEPVIVFTDHKNNTFNGLKASDCLLCTCWLLLIEEYGVTFEYLPGKNNMCNVVDALSRLDIDSLEIQEVTEEALILLSGTKNNSISHIKFSMQTALIFKEQEKVKDTGLREKA
jgi:hypothetical protein